MENNVVTLDTAKKLKAAGFPQKPTEYCWTAIKKSEITLEVYFYQDNAGYIFYAAPTAQEIVDQLPEGNSILVIKQYGGPSYSAYTDQTEDDSPHISIEAPTMAEALGALWLKLRASEQANKREK